MQREKERGKRERERETERAFESDLQQTAHTDIPGQLPASTRCQGTSGGRSGFEHVTAPLGTGYRRSLQESSYTTVSHTIF